MRKRYWKLLLLASKILIAVVLLGWVLSRSHWQDYVLDRKTGRSYAVVAARPSDAAPETLDVSRGWWRGVEKDRPAGQFVDDGAGAVRIYPGFATSIRGLRPICVLLACLGYLTSMVIISYRWYGLVRVQGIPMRLWEAIRLTFLGQFFHSIVPGTVGGDLVKAYYVAKHTPKKAAVLVSVFADRVLGLAEMTLLAGVMLSGVLVFGAAQLSDEGIRPAAITTLIVVALVAGTLVFLLSAPFRRLFHLQKLYRRLPIAHHIEAAGEAARIYARQPAALLKAVCLTFLAHVAWIGGLVVLGSGLSLPIPWYSYFVYIPLIYIIGSVPVTPGGVGLVEKLYVVFFSVSAPGMDSSLLALALLARLVVVFWGLPGLWVMVTGTKLPQARAMEAELGLADEGDPPG